MTVSFPHQADLIRDHGHDKGFALFWEPGTGKSKGLIDTAVAMYEAGEIDGLFVVAPNNLHRNFITRELPKHMSPGIVAPSLFWRTDKAQTKGHQEEARQLLGTPNGQFPVLAMSYDGIMTEMGRRLAKEFLQTRKCLYGLDESQRIANPTADRTVRILASASYAPYRRILTGTPISSRPWDIHTQIQFLDPEFWVRHGLGSIEAMKTAFGVWEKGVVRVPIGQAFTKGGKPKEARAGIGGYDYGYILKPGFALREFPALIKDTQEQPIYQNLDQLRDIVAPIRSRVLKRDVLKDLPDMLYTTVDFEMTPAQWKAYRSLEQLGFAMLDGGTTTADLAITLMLRLQQIACGYLVTDLTAGDDYSDEPRVKPFSPNPRINALLDITADLPHQALIWARFRADIDQIVEALGAQGKRVARYDGAITDDECWEHEERFHRGDLQFLVLTPERGGEGLTLTEAQTAIFYSNSFKLLSRMQAEGRPHRIGQKNAVNNIDLIARGTVDEAVTKNLVGKFDMASAITGDRVRAWLK